MAQVKIPESPEAGVLTLSLVLTFGGKAQAAFLCLGLSSRLHTALPSTSFLKTAGSAPYSCEVIPDRDAYLPTPLLHY